MKMHSWPHRAGLRGAAVLALTTLTYSAAGAFGGISSYEFASPIAYEAITEPSIIEIDLSALPPGEARWYAVADADTEALQPHFHEARVLKQRTPIEAVDTESAAPLPELVDGNPRTATTHAGSPEGVRTEFTLTARAPFTASGIVLELPHNVAWPETIAVRVDDGEYVVTPKRFPSLQIAFPATVSAVWHISLSHRQPLRISEVAFLEDTPSATYIERLRFLARPGERYELYVSNTPVASGPSSYPLSLMTAPASQVRAGAIEALGPNRRYVPEDSDGDAVADEMDNCPDVPNADQLDANRNGDGDACEDADYDGVLNAFDNCPAHINEDQWDEDGDGVGDACDSEESRFTERNAWVPWAGLGLSFALIVALFGHALLASPKRSAGSSDAEAAPLHE